MKLHLFYIAITLILISCDINRDTSKEANPPAIYNEPIQITLDTNLGYTVNVHSGDSIAPIINSTGKEIITGHKVKIIGDTLSADSIILPKTVPAKPLTELKKKLVNPSNIKIPNKNNFKSLNLAAFKSYQVEVGNTKNFVLNSTGDTVITGKNIPLESKSIDYQFSRNVSAQDPRFKDAANLNIQYLDMEQGMISSYVRVIKEDSRGNIWFGTLSGLCKYNGVEFQYFTQKQGIPFDYVGSIIEDSKGVMWFGTLGGGVFNYDGSTMQKLTEKEGLSNNDVRTLLEDKNGNIWIGTYGGGITRFDGKNVFHITKNEGLSDNDVIAIYEDKAGHIWIGTDNGVNRFDGDYLIHIDESNGLTYKTVSAICEDDEGGMWFASDGGGLNRLKDNSLFSYTSKNGISDDYLQTLYKDSEGNIWVGTARGGAFSIDNSSLSSDKLLIHNITEKDGLSNNYVFTITEDSKGNMWFGTSGGGVNRFKSQSFTHLTEKEGLTNSVIWSANEDMKGYLWFATSGGGLCRYDGEYMYHYGKEEGFPSSIIYDIHRDSKGTLWFGTDGSGAVSYSDDSFKIFTDRQGLSDNYVLSVFEDSRNDLWFGTYGSGISRYFTNNTGQKKWIHYSDANGFSNNVILSIMEDHHGNIWFGTDGAGFSIYDGETFTHFSEKEGLCDNTVLSIYEDSRHIIWLGTNNGLTAFDGNNFTTFTTNEGLTNNIVWSIVEDKQKNIWVSTEKGLNQLIFENSENDSLANKEFVNPQSIRTFLKVDGLKGEDFFLNSAFIDSQDRIWWGSGKNLTMLDMSSYKIYDDKPRIQLDQIEINEAFIDFRNISDSLKSRIRFQNVKEFYNYPIHPELDYDQNHITFYFSGIDWSASSKIKYSYRLEGLNDSWSIPGKEAKADYRNLSYGEYTFQIKAIGESSEWSDAFEYDFIIQPPWWHTWWARTAYVLFLLVGIIGFVQIRTASLKQRQKELVREVKIATTEIRAQRDELELQKSEIEEQHLKITDSIAYAKRIQNAILPPNRMIRENLPSSFIYYVPKDVVAGDFYWMHVDKDKNQKSSEKCILIAAADCTGHGVPGAMVSVICNNGLNRAVREYGLTDPGEILDKTREIVLEEFEKSDEDVKDGMDIALCTLKGNKLQFAGANNPLYVIRKDSAELEIYKSDKQPIGKFDRTTPFFTHEIDLNPGDSIYIFSDGYQDQFGGPEGKKFMISRFKKLLLSIQEESMERQMEIIANTFEVWKGKEEQVDDVCVIGVRI